MKKYIIPVVEYNSFEGVMLMYSPSDGNGSGQQTNPILGGGGGGGPLNVKVF